jgi:hypothetical protein
LELGGWPGRCLTFFLESLMHETRMSYG